MPLPAVVRWASRPPRATRPFAADLFDAALAAAGPLVGEGGLIYVEAPREIAAPAGFSVLRQGRAGAVHFHLLRRDDNPGS